MRSPGEQAEHESYLSAHGVYLTDVAHALDEQVAERNSGLMAQEFNAGDKTAFGATNDKPDSSIDPEKLGLPVFDSPGETPLGVVVTRGNGGKNEASTGAVTTITLLVRDQRTGVVHQRYLENYGLGSDDKQSNAPQWVWPGDVKLSNSVVEAKDQIVGNRDTGKSMQTIEAVGRDQDNRHSYLIRPKPTRTETQAVVGHERRSSRYVRKLGALVATATAVLAGAPFFHHDRDPEPGVDFRSPNVMVQQGDYESKKSVGVRQAEGFFSQETLTRAREAFAAYARGDTLALADQARMYGYENNWIPQDAFEAVTNAKSADEIQAAFTQALDGLPVTLKFGTESIRLTDYTFQLSVDLEDQKQTVLGIMRVYNRLDKENAQENMRPLEYVLIDSMEKNINKNEGVAKPAGMFIQGDKDTTHQIILCTKYSDTARENAAHEFAHFFIYTEAFGKTPNNLNETVDMLNPSEYEYDNYGKSSPRPVIKGNKIVGEAYSNAGKAEDAANSAGAVLADKPVIIAEESTYFEKLQAAILTLEERNPGFTSKLLESATIQYPGTDHQPANKTAEVIWNALEAGQPISSGLFGLVLLGVAASEVRSRRDITNLRNYGVLPLSAGGVVLSYYPSSKEYKPVKLKR